MFCFQCRRCIACLGRVRIELFYSEIYLVTCSYYLVARRAELIVVVRVNTEVSILACHAGDRGSIPRRGVQRLSFPPFIAWTWIKDKTFNKGCVSIISNHCTSMLPMRRVRLLSTSRMAFLGICSVSNSYMRVWTTLIWIADPLCIYCRFDETSVWAVKEAERASQILFLKALLTSYRKYSSVYDETRIILNSRARLIYRIRNIMILFTCLWLTP